MATTPFTLAACAEMVFQDLPFIQRVEKLAEMGLEVEIWGWHTKNIAELASSGATFSSMTGYLEGTLTDPKGREQILDGAKKSLAAAEELDCPRLNLHGTGLDSNGLPVASVENVTGEMWLYAAETLAMVADLGKEAGRIFTLENLNLAVDHPGTPFAAAADTLALVKQVNSTGLRMNLDLYHAQIGEGNLIELCRQSLPWIGEIQVADVPGRAQPGTGEINYPAIARALDDMGYRGTVAMEAFASGDSVEALNQFIEVFSFAND